MYISLVVNYLHLVSYCIKNIARQLHLCTRNVETAKGKKYG